VRDSFAESALWGFTMAAERASERWWTRRIFLARRAWRAGGAAEDEAGELSPGRFAMRAVFARTKNFPLNTEGGGNR